MYSIYDDVPDYEPAKARERSSRREPRDERRRSDKSKGAAYFDDVG